MALEAGYYPFNDVHAIMALVAEQRLGDADRLVNELAKAAGTLAQILQFGSTSKITMAGAGVGFMASDPSTIAGFTQHFGKASIGSDKLNQYRHIKFLRDKAGVENHMQKHAAILAAKFSLAEKMLAENFGDNDMGVWNSVQGGYFISFNT